MQEVFSFIEGTWSSLPAFVRAVLALAAGLALAFLARFLLTALLRLLKFERLSAKLGVEEFLRKGGANYTGVKLVGVLAFWFILAYTIFLVSKILDFAEVTAISAQMLEVLPKFLAAGFVTVLGGLVVSFLANFGLTIARNAGLGNAVLLSRVIKYAGIAIVLTIALEQIGLGASILGPMLLMLFGAAAFGLALAFGLGCKDIARAAMEKFLRNLRERAREGRGSDLEG